MKVTAHGRSTSMDRIIAEQKLQEAILDHELLLIAPEDEISEIWYIAWRAYEQAIISQGEPENKVIVDYDEKLKSFYINDNQLSLDKRYKAMLDASPPTNTDGY